MFVIASDLRRLVVFCLLGLLLTSTFARAEDKCTGDNADCIAVGEWQFSLGVGLGVRTNPVVEGSDLPILLLPEISYYGERFFWDTTNIGFTLVETPRHSFNLLATVGLDHIYFRDWSIGNFVIEGGAGNFSVNLAPADNGVGVGNENTDPDNGERAEEEDIRNPDPGDKDGPNEFFHSPTLAQNDDPALSPTATIDLDKRRMAALAGIDYSFYWKGTVLGAQWLHDVSDVHGGQEVRLGVDHRWQRGPQQWGLAAGAVWQSRAATDYYYGVDPHEVTGEVDFTYKPGSALTPYIRFDWQQQLSKNWTLQATLHHKWLDSAIANSPIVDDNTSTSVFVGGVYHF